MTDIGVGSGLGGGPSIAGEGAIEAADASGGWNKRQIILLALGVFLVLAAVRWITDTPDLTSSGTVGSTLRLDVPILLAALGGIYAERSGVVNIGLEGMIILGTWFGAWGAWQYGPWWGVAIGIAGGAAGGLLHAIATVSFGVDHIISGVVIITLSQGVTRFLSVETYDATTGGGATQSPRVSGVGNVNIPFLSGGELFGWRTPDVLGRVESWGWLGVSDAAGLARGFTHNVSWLALIALALVPLTWFILWRTTFGLRLRSCGENPTAADSLGVPVYTLKYAGVIISGALAGMGGAFLATESGLYRQGQTNGKGFIGLAAVIFGNWRPFGAAVGSGLFGFADALQLRDAGAVHALLLFVAIITGALTIWWAVKGRTRLAWMLGTVCIGFAIWFGTTDEVPVQFVGFTPHIITIIVLALAARRLRMPAANGLQWRRGRDE